MIVSWNWLKEYVRLDMPAETLANRLMMAGLNLESIDDVEGDIAIDLEVTSNRPDCLCHIGVARETAALFERDWKQPPAAVAAHGPDVHTLTQIELQASDLCPRYTARLVRGVRVAPSPQWLQTRLKTLGIRPINNVVDATNYVLMECGQPLHAFDFDRLDGRRIVVRRGVAGESLQAIDQRVYQVTPEMCVIADASRPVAIAGVMGGFDSEINERTVNVLIEAADFSSMSVRSTARKLNLHSDSSYRFERGIDRAGLDWASRRCAELILQTAGGELCSGVIETGVSADVVREPVVLRYSQIKRVLGIEIPQQEVDRILQVLGLTQQVSQSADAGIFMPPTWRRDLTREIDLIEEAARVYGYEKIPENVPVPLAVSTTTRQDRLVERLATTLVGAGFFEAVTLSFVGTDLQTLVRPWSDKPALAVEHSSRQRENLLRQSLIPSLLAVRRQNERHGNLNAQLFEVARIFLGADPGNPQAEPKVIAGVSGRSFSELKGVVEQLIAVANRQLVLETRATEGPWFQPGRGAELLLNGSRLGWLGEVSEDVRKALDLHDPVTMFELDLLLLEQSAQFSPAHTPFAEFPAMERDLNFVLDDEVTWSEVEQVVRTAGGALLENVVFASQYRGPQIPANKKSYVFRLFYRSSDRTLTGDEVDQIQQQVVATCIGKLGAVQR